MSELHFDDQVVIVTGAGNGLGRSHALEFARRGARVVVNDLGGSRTGEGKSSEAADQVVETIRSAGGIAVANYDSVEHGEAIVATAMDHFGCVDIVINNAGILRDITFAKMTEADWDLVQRVHLKGAYSVTKAAWPVMQAQNSGNIIFTSSAAGIYGNFGQANYSACKLAVHGMSQTLALEGAKHNIRVNSIAPVAGSRMTETILPPQLLEALKPEAITALVVYLCSGECQETGSLFETGAGWTAKLRWERSEGIALGEQEMTRAESIAEQWSTICDFEQSSHPTRAEDTFAVIMNLINKVNSGGVNAGSK